jgi:dephospho-CoA kinase
MDLIGLTGGIATGKTTVAQMLRELGATVIDADEAARAVVEPGTPGLQAVVEAFGPEVLDGDRLDRARLGEIVFGDENARRRLEAITHPLVRQWMAERQRQAEARGDERVVLDIPLLFESGLEGGMRSVILVYAPPDIQVQRLTSRNRLSPDDARRRVAAQMPIDEKVGRATYVIDNAGSPDSTRDQVRKVWSEITASRLTGP